MRVRSTTRPTIPTPTEATAIAGQTSRPARSPLTVKNAPSIRNSPWARLITPIIPKITASPSEMMTSTATLPSSETASSIRWSYPMWFLVRRAGHRSARSVGELLVEVGILDQIADGLLVRRRDAGLRLEDLEALRVIGLGD